LSDNSSIIYVNQDIESESVSEGSKFLFTLKRLKNTPIEIEPTIKKRIRYFINRMKKKSSQTENLNKTNFFYTTKYIKSNSQIVSINFISNIYRNSSIVL
jgi:hypothetical protein